MALWSVSCTSDSGIARLVNVPFDPVDDIVEASTNCASAAAGTPPPPAAYDLEQATFGGLLRRQSEETPQQSVRYIFHTHGMGLTSRCEFTTELLKALEDRGYRRIEEPGPWIPAAIQRVRHVRGDALACEGAAAHRPPCRLDSFGEYRIDRLQGPGGDQAIVVSYYWHLDLWRAQYPFLRDDLRQDPGFISGRLKHETIDGGLSDAAAYLGELGDPLREGMATAICAMVRDAAGLIAEPSDLSDCLTGESASRVSSDVQFGFLSHSLGSRMLFDVLAGSWKSLPPVEGRAGRAMQDPTRELLAAQTTSFFMAANQLPLLGPGRVRVTDSPPPEPPEALGACADMHSFLALRCALQVSGDRRAERAGTLDIIGFHDPGDLLGFRVSGGMASTVNGVRFYTVEHRNTPQVLWAGSSPLSAHDHELKRPTSLGLILCGGVEMGDILRPRACGSVAQ